MSNSQINPDIETMKKKTAERIEIVAQQSVPLTVAENVQVASEALMAVSFAKLAGETLSTACGALGINPAALDQIPTDGDEGTLKERAAQLAEELNDIVEMVMSELGISKEAVELAKQPYVQELLDITGDMIGRAEKHLKAAEEAGGNPSTPGPDNPWLVFPAEDGVTTFGPQGEQS